MKKWLITGGAGYIGAHVVRNLIASGNQVLVLDNFSTGKLSRIVNIGEYVNVDCRNLAELQTVIINNKITGVIHLAANKHARESIKKPEKYWENNVGAMLSLVQAVKGSMVKKIILSSSCSVYGSNPRPDIYDPRSPISPYGRTKLVCEDILQDYCEEQGIQWAILRYFNVVGCDNFTDSADDSEECLIPLLIRRMRESLPISIFGNNYETPDGTALRDYIDVRDLASAHVMIAEQMYTRPNNIIVNVSSGRPISVLEVVKTVEQISGKKFIINIADRNIADPAVIWSPPSEELIQIGWKPRIAFVNSVASHWNHPNT